MTEGSSNGNEFEGNGDGGGNDHDDIYDCYNSAVTRLGGGKEKE